MHPSSILGMCLLATSCVATPLRSIPAVQVWDSSNVANLEVRDVHKSSKKWLEGYCNATENACRTRMSDGRHASRICDKNFECPIDDHKCQLVKPGWHGDYGHVGALCNLKTFWDRDGQPEAWGDYLDKTDYGYQKGTQPADEGGVNITPDEIELKHDPSDEQDSENVENAIRFD